LPVAEPAAEHVSAQRLEVAHQALDRYVDEGKYAGYVSFFARHGKIVDWHAHGWRDVAAGNPVAIELFRRAHVWEAANLDDFVQRVAKLPVLENPGERFRYGINLDILGAIIEKVSGQRYDRYLDEHIFKPLGMRDTAFWVPAEKQDRLAKLYKPDESGKLTATAPLNSREPKPDGTGVQSGGGGLYSTAGDYARFAQMLLNGGQLDGVRILSRKTVELMSKNHIAHLAYPHPFDREDRGYGLAVQMITDLGRGTALGSEGMWGWDGAASTICWIDPKEQTIAIMITQRFPFNAENFLTAFVDVYYSSFDD
jgi:CubicO group peptidase (beta-lactamase class C family)